MPYLQDTQYDLKPHIDCIYFISSHHRRKSGNMHKSIWTITYDKEVSLFILAKNSSWSINNVCWGLLIENNIIQSVGRNQLNPDLKIAKYIDSSNNNIWHGYPADYLNKKQDIPDMEILLKWKEYISKSDIRKIKQQLPCSL